MTTAAEIIAQKLHDAGCRHAFGMPGGEVLVLMQALDQVGIEFSLCKHENNAGYMAEGTYHATGAPAILLTTIGPGLANGLNSVANAFQEQVPMIVLSGCITATEAASFTHQVIDQSALMAPITKAQFQIGEGSAQAMIEKAIAIAKADPPGPVHVDVPHNIAPSEIQVIERALQYPAAVNWAEDDGLAKARKMLANAGRPIILAGLGAVHHHAGAAILALAETRNIPVLTTYKAKGIIPEDHALSLGGHGLSPLSDTVVLPLLAKSDCIILAGYDPIEMRNGWIEPWHATVAIDISHADIQHGMHGSAVRFIGNVANAIAALSNTTSHGQSWVNGEPSIVKTALQDMFSDRAEWGPHTVFATIQNTIPAGSIAVADSGAHRILLSQMWHCLAPQTLLQSSCFCTMGISLPLAIGYAKAAGPNGPKVIAFIGDAGLEMVIGELATLRDMHLPVIVVLLVDQSLSLIELKQSRSNLPNLGVDFASTDFVSIVNAYGGNAVWVDSSKSLKNALNSALCSKNFSLLACRIDKTQYAGAF